MATGEAPVIFVVDDDTLSLRVITQVLRRAGYTVEAYENPREFLAVAPCKRHGCALLDMSMPELSGLAVQRVLTDRDGTLPVLFLTGSADVRDSVSAMKAGALDLLLKPVDPEELLAAVARAVEASREVRAARAASEALKVLLLSLTTREREVAERLATGMLTSRWRTISGSARPR